MSTGVDLTTESFRPKSSWGWVWLVGTALLLLLAVGLTAQAAGEEEVPILVWAVNLAIFLIAIWMIGLTASLPLMRYDLTMDSLVISCGPMLRYTVPYRSIIEVARRDLSPTLWSSMRFPGLALYKVGYVEGVHFMCSTRAAKGVLVIETSSSAYGLSPAEEERFVAALTSRLGTGSR